MVIRLEHGDKIKLEVERRVIYAGKHVPAGRISTKRFHVVGDGQYGYTLRPLGRSKKIRGWRLSRDFERLDSFTKPPLSYDVLSIEVIDL